MHNRVKAALTILLSLFMLSSVMILNTGSVQAQTLTDLDQCASFTRFAVEYLAGRGIISGNNGKFNPKDTLTRAQMVKMIVSSMGMDISNPPDEPSFVDVPPAHWSYPYVEAALKDGIIAMSSSKIFAPDEKTTREQMSAMFVRSLGITPEMMLMNQNLDNVSKLKDKSKVSSWAAHSVEFSLRNGLMAGVGGGRFAPSDKAERQQAALAIYNFLMNKDKLLNVKAGFRVGKPFITLGATREGVRDIMEGAYHQYYGDQYGYYYMVYNDFTVIIDGTTDTSRVVGWYNPSRRNKFIVGPFDPKAPPFKIGSTATEVGKASGTPMHVNHPIGLLNRDNYWVYPDNSIIVYDSNLRVKRYINNGSLKVSLGEKAPDAAPIDYRSKIQDVVKAAGTPDMVNTYFIKDHDYKRNAYHEELINPSPYMFYQYKNSYVAFDKNEKIVHLVNTGNLPVDFGQADPGFPGINVFSEAADIVKAMGTPDKIYDRHWYYGESVIAVDENGIVQGWTDKGNLKIAVRPGDANAPVITLASTKQDVLNLMGTPESFVDGNWIYGSSRIQFNTNGLIENIYRPSELMLSKSTKDDSSPGFTFGSTYDEVIEAMGSPTEVKKDGYEVLRTSWQYEGQGPKTRIFFSSQGKVVYWDGHYANNGIYYNGLKLAQPEQYDPDAPPVTLGSTTEEVLRALGAPLSMSEPEYMKNNGWFYQEGILYITYGKVSGWRNEKNTLKVFIDNEEVDAFFTYGSTKSEVAKAMGTPHTVGKWYYELDTWQYDGGWIGFDELTQKVIAWDNTENLKLKNTAQSTATFIKIGSTREDVFKVMGLPDRLTPTSYNGSYLSYGRSAVLLDYRGVVTELRNIDNNLILK